MTIELGYFTIGVADVARARKFYGALFGWEFNPAASNEQYAHVSNAKLPFGLYKAAPADLSAFYFRGDDIDAMVAKVRALGGKPGEITKSDSGLMSLCVDDQGTKFSVWQPAAGF